MVVNYKSITIILGIVGAVAGVSVGYGGLKTDVDNNKKEIIEKRKVDLEQTIVIERVVVQLTNLAKITEKLEKKLDK